MPDLELAVGIAEALDNAKAEGKIVDFTGAADHLVAAHPEASSSREDILETLQSEALHDLLA